jgi:hypothetical protein
MSCIFKQLRAMYPDSASASGYTPPTYLFERIRALEKLLAVLESRALLLKGVDLL